MLVLALGLGVDGCTGPRTIGELYGSWLQGYDKRVRPGAARPAGAVVRDRVELQLEVIELHNVNTMALTVTIRATQRYVWKDWRLAYNGTEHGGCIDGNAWDAGFRGSYLSELWSPQYQWRDIIELPAVIDSSFWVLPSGLVWYSLQSVLTVSCHMTFKQMPYDTHDCPFVAYSELYYDDREVFIGFLGGIDSAATGGTDEVDSGILYMDMAYDSVEWSLLPPYAEFEQTSKDLFNETITRYHVVFARKAGSYNNFVIVPILLMVLMSWGSFFVARNVMPARLGMSTVLFMTLSARVSSIQAEIPKQQHQVWLLSLCQISQVFSFLAVMTVIVVGYLMKVRSRLVIALTSLPAEHPALVGAQSHRRFFSGFHMHPHHPANWDSHASAMVHRDPPWYEALRHSHVHIAVATHAHATIESAQPTDTAAKESRTADLTSKRAAAVAAREGEGAAMDQASTAGDTRGSHPADTTADHGQEQLSHALERHVGHWTSRILVRADRRMRFDDMHVDAFFRWLFLPFYVIAVLATAAHARLF